MIATVGVIRITRHLFTVEDYLFIFGLGVLTMLLVFLLGKYTRMDEDQSDDESSDDDSDSDTGSSGSPTNGMGRSSVMDALMRYR